MLFTSLAVHLALCGVINGEKHTLSFEKVGWANADSIEDTARPIKWLPTQILTTPDSVRIAEGKQYG